MRGRTHNARTRWAALTVVLAGLLWLGPAQALAHSSFLESAPAPGASLERAPERIAMLYTEPLNDRLTRLRLVDARSGRPVPGTVRVSRGRRLELRPRGTLAAGAYRLEWRSVSTIDGHIREGSVGFGVRTAALGGAVEVQQSPLTGAGPLRAAVRWLFYLALFLFAGGVLNAALLARRASLGAWLVPGSRSPLAGAVPDPDAVAARAASRTLRAGALAATGAVLVTAVESIDAAGGVRPSGMADFLLGGPAGISRLLMVGAVVGAAILARRAAAPAAALLTVALFAIALGGHAGGAEMPLLGVASDWVHLVAAGIWAGGIAQLAWAWLPTLRYGDQELRRAVLGTALPRFGRVALPAFIIVSATGLLNALVQLGDLSALVTTAYGRVLTVKIALVAAAGGLSWLHAIRARPALERTRPGAPLDARVERIHRRAFGAEAPVGALILAAAALLVAFPVPPREAREALAAAAPPVAACSPCPLPKPTADELAVAAAAGTLTVAGWLRSEAGGLSMTIRVLDRRRKPVDVEPEVAGAQPGASCGTGCHRFRVPGRPPALAVTVVDGSQRRRVELPARWADDSGARARRILARAQRRMRGLATFRQAEYVQSAVAAGRRVRTDFVFQAPDRMRYEGLSTAGVIIGRRMWLRPDPVTGWQPAAPAETALRVRDGFRWGVFAETARLLGVRTDGGRRVADLAFLDWGYPVWYRLQIDLDRDVVLEARLTTPENRIDDRFSGFDAPARVMPPPTT